MDDRYRDELDGRLMAELFEKLGIGRFRLDADDRILWVDEGWLRLYNIASVEEVRGQPISIVNPYDKGELTRKVQRSKNWAATGIYLVKRKVGDAKYEHFFAEVVTAGLWEEGLYVGRHGYVRDVTDREIRRRVEEQLKVGLYIAHTRGEDDHIVYCNETFAKLFGFANKESVLGIPVKELYAYPLEHQEFLDRLRQQKKGSILGRKISVKKRNGDVFPVDVNVVWEERGDVIERFGILKDLRQDDTYTEFIRDIGIVIHAYQTALIGIRHTLEAFTDTLAPDPFPPQSRVLHGAAERELEKPLEQLEEALAKLEQATLSQNEIDTFFEPIQFARQHIIYDEHANAGFRWQELLPERLEATNSVLSICRKWEYDYPHRKALLAPVQSAAGEIQRLLLLIMMHQLTFNLHEVAHELRLFQDYVTQSVREDERMVFDLWEIVEVAANNLASYAQKKDIDFKVDKQFTGPALIEGEQRSILRAITGVLHNAIKYSWQRMTGGYVLVRMKKVYNEYELYIEDYGVGIPQDELDEGAIFRFGYRGRLSGERGRVGTGMGLYDAKRVFELHGGSIKITSKPATHQSSGFKSLKDIPHLTGVTIRLPAYQEVTS